MQIYSAFLEFNAHATGRRVTLIDTSQGRKSSWNAAGEFMDQKCEDFSTLPWFSCRHIWRNKCVCESYVLHKDAQVKYCVQ